MVEPRGKAFPLKVTKIIENYIFRVILCVFFELFSDMKTKTFPKDRYIDSIPDATESDKARYKELFRKCRQLEKKIDWNNKAELSKATFEALCNEYYHSKDISYQFENSDFKIIGENQQFLFIQVLSYNGARYINSYKCGGQGAKWCTGDWNSIQKWVELVTEGRIFVLAYSKAENADENMRKFMLEYDPRSKKITCHNQNNEETARIYDNKVIEKFRPPFSFSEYPFKSAKKPLLDFFASTALDFLCCYKDIFDQNLTFNNGRNITVKLSSNPQEYNNLTVNDTIFLIIKTISDLCAETPVHIEISADIYKELFFKTDYGNFTCNVQLFNEFVIPNIILYANNREEIQELLNLENSIIQCNFSEIVRNYNEYKKTYLRLKDKYDFSFRTCSGIVLDITGKSGTDLYIVRNFSYIGDFNENKDFSLYRFRRDTNRFYITYGSFSRDFEVALTDETFKLLEEFFNHVRGLKENQVEKIFEKLKIDTQGNLIFKEKNCRNIKEIACLKL